MGIYSLRAVCPEIQESLNTYLNFILAYERVQTECDATDSYTYIRSCTIYMSYLHRVG